MQPTLPDADVDAGHRRLMILWFAFLSTIGLYFVISLFLQRPETDNGQNTLLTLIFSAMGTLLVLLSFAVKHKFLVRSVEKQELGLVQTGFVGAFALCEAGALLGLLDRLLTGNRYYFVSFALAAIGIVFHFPRRDHLLAATHKQ